MSGVVGSIWRWSLLGGCLLGEGLPTQQSHLRTHRRSKHEGFKFSCDKCEYKSTHKSSVDTHTQSIHEGVKYSFDK